MITNPYRRSWCAATIAALTLAVTTAPACDRGADTARAGRRAAQARRAGPARAVPVAVATARRGTITASYVATATLAPESEAEVLARVAGVVESLRCEEGDRVRAGQVLLRLDNDEYLWRLRQAQARRADLESRLVRLEAMRKRELVSDEAYETLRNDLEAARAEEGLARTNLAYTTVRAPFDGTVVARHVDVGQSVNPATALVTVADLHPLLARVHVPARAFRGIRAGQPVRLVLESDGTRLRGRIRLVSPTIDPSSGTVKITVEIPEYPTGVRPGDFAEVHIVTERRDGRVLVPRRAVIADRGERVVFVAAADTAERRVVEVGLEDDEHAEIVAGVTEGEAVVVRGQRTLEHGAPLRILERDGRAVARGRRRAAEGP